MRGSRYFYFALAHELHMTVADLLSRLDAYELTEWQAYFAIRDSKQQDTDPNSVDGKITDKMLQFKSWS